MRIPATTLIALLLLSAAAGGEPVDVTAFEWIPTWRPPVVRAFPEYRLVDAVRADEDDVDLPERDLTMGIEALLSELPAGGKPSRAEILSGIRNFLHGPATVSVSIAFLPRKESPPPKDAAGVAAALKSGSAELLWSDRFATRRGEWVEKDDLALRTLLAWMEVEVAQEASIADPMPMELSLGTRVAVQCLPDTGEGATVRLSLQVALDPTHAETVRTSSGTLDLVEVPFVSLFAGMNLQRGTPELILLGHPSEPGLIAVVVNLVDTRPVGDLPFLLVDLSAAAGEPEVAQYWMRAGIRTMWGRDPYMADPEPFWTARDARLELVDAIPAAHHLLTPTVAAITAGGQDAGKTVLALSARSRKVERVRVRMPWVELQRSSEFDPLTGSFQTGYLPSDAFPLRLPVLDGTATLLHAGTWRLFLSSEKVEIAQAAAIHWPLVGVHIEGETLRLTGSGPTRVEQTTSRLIDRDRREIDVRKDVLGKREPERSHLIDFLRTLDSSRGFTVGPRGATNVRREEEEAVVEVWR